MANFKLTQTKEQIQADLDLLDKNTATAGQVLTANGTGGASWQNAAGGGSGGGTQLYRHVITDNVQIISTRSAVYSEISDIDTDYGIICINFYDPLIGPPAIGSNCNWLWHMDIDENSNRRLLLSTYIGTLGEWINETVTTISDTVTPL